MTKNQPSIIEAKTLRMANADFLNIAKNANQIIYAEWALPGAMGCAGTARLYAFKDKALIQYETGMGELYDEVYDLIHGMSDRKWTANLNMWQRAQPETKFTRVKNTRHFLKSAYGCFGNYAWKNSKVKFTRDDKHSGFIFANNHNYYRVRCSVKGVYSSIKDEFAPNSRI